MATASPSPTLDLDTLTLTRGNHDGPTEGACLMEAVSWLAGEPWSDHPQCVSTVIGAFLRRWQDDLDDTTRQTLKRYIPLVLGTNTGAADEQVRAWMVTDWMVRTYLPAWLRLGGMGSQADVVAALAPLVDDASADAAATALSAAYSAADSAARSAADSAAYWWDGRMDIDYGHATTGQVIDLARRKPDCADLLAVLERATPNGGDPTLLLLLDSIVEAPR